MPVLTRYRCLNCGERFEIEVFTPEEIREVQRQRRPVARVACPKCHRTDLDRGWG
jgi:DNA-directed RNA polymerase subunit RPC12/RpoP